MSITNTVIFAGLEYLDKWDLEFLGQYLKISKYCLNNKIRQGKLSWFISFLPIYSELDFVAREMLEFIRFVMIKFPSTSVLDRNRLFSGVAEALSTHIYNITSNEITIHETRTVINNLASLFLTLPQMQFAKLDFVNQNSSDQFNALHKLSNRRNMFYTLPSPQIYGLPANKAQIFLLIFMEKYPNKNIDPALSQIPFLFPPNTPLFSDSPVIGFDELKSMGIHLADSIMLYLPKIEKLILPDWKFDHLRIMAPNLIEFNQPKNNTQNVTLFTNSNLILDSNINRYPMSFTQSHLDSWIQKLGW